MAPPLSRPRLRSATRAAAWRVAWGILAMNLLLSPLAAAEAPQPARYDAVSGDLFPADSDVDLAVHVSGVALWSVDGSTLHAGAAEARAVEPRPGTLDVEVQFRLPRACCPRQYFQGSRTLVGLLPLEAQDLPVLVLDGAEVHVSLRGSLNAYVHPEGSLAAAEPASLRFDAWQTLPVQLTARDGDAPARAALATTFVFVLTARLERGGEPLIGTFNGTVPGSPLPPVTLPVAAGPARAAVPWAGTAPSLAAIVLTAWVMRRRRQE